jgi:hypothetical protein
MRVNDVIGIMVSVFDDWQGLLANPRFVRNGNSISWVGCEPRIISYPLTRAAVVELAEQGQYTFQFTDDGSLLQMAYSFTADGVTLRSANLAYYAVPRNVIPMDEAADVMEEAPVAGEAEIPWLRIDYDPETARGVLHGECHLHLSGFPNSRFLVDGVPTPRQFVEFVIALCYPEAYRERRLKDDGTYAEGELASRLNTPAISCVATAGFATITHVRVPRHR